MTILGYVFTCDSTDTPHCPDCAMEDLLGGTLKSTDPVEEVNHDEHDIPLNLVHSGDGSEVFTIDDEDDLMDYPGYHVDCYNCGNTIACYDHSCGEFADQCDDGYCTLGINGCANHDQEAGFEDDRYPFDPKTGCVIGCFFEQFNDLSSEGKTPSEIFIILNSERETA